jgi:hypothetical protein
MFIMLPIKDVTEGIPTHHAAINSALHVYDKHNDAFCPNAYETERIEHRNADVAQVNIMPKTQYAQVV